MFVCLKVKNCWKLRDGLLMERQVECGDSGGGSGGGSGQFRADSVYFTLSHPLNEIKPVLFKTLPDERIYAYYSNQIISILK